MTAAAKDTESTRTGTLTNIPFCIVGEEEERNATDEERERVLVEYEWRNIPKLVLN